MSPLSRISDFKQAKVHPSPELVLTQSPDNAVQLAEVVKPGENIVVIVGGGFSGAAVALHLARNAQQGAYRRVIVFEPRANLGAGLAYDTQEPTHRINVPAGNMSLYADDAESFLRFAEASDHVAADAQVRNGTGQIFPARSVFGAYVAHELAPHLASGAVEHRRHAVTSIKPSGARWLVEDDQGNIIVADIVVLAASHPAPALPSALVGLAGQKGLIEEGAGAGALKVVDKNDRVLVVGNGLTAADVIATLHRLGHRGQITAVSRRGLRSKGHASEIQTAYGDFLSPASTRASHLLRRIRVALREAAALNIGWHAVLDAVRLQGQDIWRALPLSERRRLVRHARPYWDVHRFRIAPQVEAVLDAAIAEGRLSILAARLQSAYPDADGIHVVLKPLRGEANEQVFDRVIVTTGPAHGGILDSQPFLQGLHKGSYLALCATGLGIACDRQSHAINRSGMSQPNLLIAGPLARGTFGELMGLPQVSDHAAAVAAEVETLLTVQTTTISTASNGQDSTQ